MQIRWAIYRKKQPTLNKLTNNKIKNTNLIKHFIIENVCKLCAKIENKTKLNNLQEHSPTD